jgi:hypothetical protein
MKEEDLFQLMIVLIITFGLLILLQMQVSLEVEIQENCNQRYGKGNWMWNDTIKDCVYTENPPVIPDIKL